MLQATCPNHQLSASTSACELEVCAMVWLLASAPVCTDLPYAWCRLSGTEYQGQRWLQLQRSLRRCTRSRPASGASRAVPACAPHQPCQTQQRLQRLQLNLSHSTPSGVLVQLMRAAMRRPCSQLPCCTAERPCRRRAHVLWWLSGVQLLQPGFCAYVGQTMLGPNNMPL